MKKIISTKILFLFSYTFYSTLTFASENVEFVLDSFTLGSKPLKSYRMAVPRKNINQSAWISTEVIIKSMDKSHSVSFTFGGKEVQSHVRDYVATHNQVEQKVTGYARFSEKRAATEECFPWCNVHMASYFERIWHGNDSFKSREIELDSRSGYYFFHPNGKKSRSIFEVFNARPPASKLSKELYVGYCRGWGMGEDEEHVKCWLESTWVKNPNSEENLIFLITYTLPLRNLKHRGEVAEFIKSKLSAWIRAGEESGK